MFTSRYFNGRYWAARYWAKIGAVLNAGQTDVDKLTIARADIISIKSATESLGIELVANKLTIKSVS